MTSQRSPIPAPPQPAISTLELRVREVFGDPISAAVWYRCPNRPAFGRWISPAELAREGSPGRSAVISELEHVAATLPGAPRPTTR